MRRYKVTIVNNSNSTKEVLYFLDANSMVSFFRQNGGYQVQSVDIEEVETDEARTKTI